MGQSLHRPEEIFVKLKVFGSREFLCGADWSLERIWWTSFLGEMFKESSLIYCAYIYIYTYIYVYIYIFTYVYIYIYIYVYESALIYCACIYTYIYIYVYIYIYLHMYINIVHIYIYIYMYIWLCLYMYVYIYIYISIVWQYGTLKPWGFCCCSRLESNLHRLMSFKSRTIAQPLWTWQAQVDLYEKSLIQLGMVKGC